MIRSASAMRRDHRRRAVLVQAVRGAAAGAGAVLFVVLGLFALEALGL